MTLAATSCREDQIAAGVNGQEPGSVGAVRTSQHKDLRFEISEHVVITARLQVRDSSGLGSLSTRIEVYNPTEGMRVVYEIDAETAIDARKPVDLYAGERLMYVMQPAPGYVWREVLSGEKPESLVLLERVEGAAEEP